MTYFINVLKKTWHNRLIQERLYSILYTLYSILYTLYSILYTLYFIFNIHRYSNSIIVSFYHFMLIGNVILNDTSDLVFVLKKYYFHFWVPY